MSKDILSDCANCQLPISERVCMRPQGKGHVGCPTLAKRELVKEAAEEYHKDNVLCFARNASIQEGEGYADRDKIPYVLRPVKPRIQEICEFAHKMGYTRLGLVFCMGLLREGNVVAQILKSQEFEVVSVVCKVGSTPKEEIGIKDEEKVRIGHYEAMCNPILQAMIVNDANVDLNITLGLCVGHDSLFFRYAEAPTTVLAVKDRVTGHNPLSAIYTSDTYYSRLKRKGF